MTKMFAQSPSALGVVCYLLFSLTAGAAPPPDSLIVSDQRWTLEEGAAAGTIIDTVATDSTVAARFTLVAARLLGWGTDRQDTVPDPTSAVAIEPPGVLVVRDPTHLLAVNGPLELTVRATTDDGSTDEEVITVAIRDQRHEATPEASGSWTVGQSAAYPAVKDPPGRQGVLEGQSVVVGGKLYAFGGFDRNFSITDSSYVYDPATDRWVSIRPLPRGGYVGAGFTTDGQDIYLAGGNAGDRQNRPVAAAYRYVVADDRYEPLPPLPVPLGDGGLEYRDGRLYFVGGTDSTRTVDESDFYVLDLSDLATGWQPLAPLPNPRGHFGTAVVAGQLYVLGGQHQHDERAVAQDDVHAYDFSTNTWRLVSDLPDVSDVPADIIGLPDSLERLRSAGKGHISSGTYTDGERIYLVGGEYRHGGGAAEGEPNAYYSAALLAYEPAADRWWQLPDLRWRASDTTALRTRSGLGGIIDSTLHYISPDQTHRTIPLPTFPAPPPPPPPPTPTLPTVTDLGPQTHYRGDSLVDWPVLAVGETEVALTFQSSGLPDGLRLDSLSGTVSGTITAEAGDYAVTVLVTSEQDSTEVSWVWTVSETLVTGLPDYVSREALRLYPNPASDWLRIAWPGDAPPRAFTLRIYDARGRQWLQRTVSSSSPTVGVAQLPTGIYWVHILHGSAVLTRRLVVR